MLLNEVPIGSIIVYPEYDKDRKFIVIGHDKIPSLYDWNVVYDRLILLNEQGLVENRDFTNDSLLQFSVDKLWKIVCLP